MGTKTTSHGAEVEQLKGRLEHAARACGTSEGMLLVKFAKEVSEQTDKTLNLLTHFECFLASSVQLNIGGDGVSRNNMGNMGTEISHSKKSQGI